MNTELKKPVLYMGAQDQHTQRRRYVEPFTQILFFMLRSSHSLNADS